MPTSPGRCRAWWPCSHLPLGVNRSFPHESVTHGKGDVTISVGGAVATLHRGGEHRDVCPPPPTMAHAAPAGRAVAIPYDFPSSRRAIGGDWVLKGSD